MFFKNPSRKKFPTPLLSFLLFFVFLFSGCSSLHLNPPLKQAGSPDGYSFNNLLAAGNRIGDNLVIVTFSGGGTRAAAFAYGVMQAMDEIQMSEDKTLLDDVNIISSVSGGSFTSSYYGLYGKEKFFRDFRRDFLDQKFSTRLIRDLFRFVNWIPLAFSASTGRSDLGERIYDSQIFKGHTFADMPRKWPFIIINSTDMTRGNTFSFIQENFDLLCSDLNQVKISRAVMASSAFPGPFTALTLKNYPKSQCGYREPAWVAQALERHPEENLESYTWAQTMRFYEDTKVRPYIHLLDGGVSDNIGLRPLLFAFRTGLWDILSEDKHFKVKRVILIVVDAKPTENFKIDQRAAVPGLMQTLNDASSRPMRNYSTATIKDFMLRFEENRNAAANYEALQKLCDQVHSSAPAREACYAQYKFPFGGINKPLPPYPDTYLIHVQFDALQDPELKKQVSMIKTDLQLEKKNVDALIRAGGEIFRDSPNYKRLLNDLEKAQ